MPVPDCSPFDEGGWRELLRRGKRRDRERVKTRKKVRRRGVRERMRDSKEGDEEGEEDVQVDQSQERKDVDGVQAAPVVSRSRSRSAVLAL